MPAAVWTRLVHVLSPDHLVDSDDLLAFKRHLISQFLSCMPEVEAAVGVSKHQFEELVKQGLLREAVPSGCSEYWVDLAL